jgi:membrane protease subunit HflK
MQVSDTKDAAAGPTLPGGASRLIFRQIGKILQPPHSGREGVFVLAVYVALCWLLSGVYNVQPDEQALVLRFGRWVDAADPGLHFHWPAPIETVALVKVTRINQFQIAGASPVQFPGLQATSKSQMLTGDENIVEADCAVFWKISDPLAFLFRVADPEGNLRSAAESALRKVVSRYPIQDVLSARRQEVAEQVRDELQRQIDVDRAGIAVTQVQLLRTDPPNAVIDAFNDVQRAREDRVRASNEAEAYANDILPRARGQAAQILQDAEAYRGQVLNLAQGEAKSFLAVYASYARFKEVTAWRLYMDSVDELMKRAGKIVIDSTGRGAAQVMPFLPLQDAERKASTGGAR